MIIWRDGDWCAEADAVIAADDRGFLLGDGLFETIRVRAGNALQLDRHFDRLERSCEALGFDMPDRTIDFGDVIRQLCICNQLRDAVVRLTLTAGPGPRGLDRPSAGTQSVMLAAHALAEPPAHIDLVTVPIRRSNTAPGTAHKTLGYVDNIQARRLARMAGGGMALLCDTAGHVSGADCANLFWVEDGRLKTPALSCGVLPGIARSVLLDTFGGDEAEVQADVLFDAELVFVTNALWPGVRVATLDGRGLGEDPDMIARINACLA